MTAAGVFAIINLRGRCPRAPARAGPGIPRVCRHPKGVVKTEKNILKLDPRATAVELDGKPGLRLNDDIRLAADNAQAAILRALLTGAKPIDSL